MSLGAALLTPQSLGRMENLTPQQAFGDDLLALAWQILGSPDQVRSIGPLFAAAFERMGQRLAARMQARLDEAMDAARDLAAPAVTLFQGLAAQAGTVQGPLDVLGLLEDVLDTAARAVQGLSEPALRDVCTRVHGIVTGPLGLSQAALQDELRAVFADVRAGLLDGSAVLTAQQAGVRYALAALIGRIERELIPQFPTFDLSPARVAQLLHGALRQAGIDDLRAQIVCLIGKLRALLTAGRTLGEIASGNFGLGSVGAGEARPAAGGDQYCWYASWLYATKRRAFDADAWLKILSSLTPGYPDDEVWLSADKTQLILRRAGADDEVLHTFTGADPKWFEAAPFATTSAPECYSFGAVGPEFLETWTRVIAALAELAKVGWHIAECASSPREKGANIPLMFYYFTRFLTNVTEGAPLASAINKGLGWGVGSQWLWVWLPWLMVILGSLEGKHTETNAGNQFLGWVTLLGGDALSAFNIHTFIGGGHSIALSLWTLMNQAGPAGATGDPDTRPDNREHGGPIIGLHTALAVMLLTKLIPREDYAYPFHGDNPKFYLYWLLCAPLMGLGGAAVGTLNTWAISRTYDAAQLGEEIGFGAFTGFLSFLVQQYTGKEGDTADGTYNPKKDPDGDDYAPARVDFTGYPAADTSPYRLPYEKDKVLFVGQANQGMFSHMRFNWLPQIYAYDFAHDFGDEVLAARAGTVVDWFDWIADDTDPTDAQIFDAIKAAIGWAGPGEPTQTDVNNAAANPASGLIAGQTGIANLGWFDGTEGPPDWPDPALIKPPGTFKTAYFNWNFIVIRHDAVDAAHDTDVLDPSLRAQFPCTYAVYGHGKTGSVREVFAARGVTDPRNIIGQTVQRGQVIMHAGDVGTSFHNHLHMHVLGGPAPAPGAVSRGFTRFTLPFVFREAKHVFGRDGVLRHLTWYTSDNPRVP